MIFLKKHTRLDISLDSLGFLRIALGLQSWNLCTKPLSLFTFFQKNGTHEGEFVFHTGEQNYLDYGKIDTWNGLRWGHNIQYVIVYLMSFVLISFLKKVYESLSNFLTVRFRKKYLVW